jgi:predicted ATP-dependent endonuclease of OLD family
LLQELAAGDDAISPRLILGCEEPELYQHPPQARHLAEVLLQLSEQNAQVVICTHSPFFVSGENFESVRMVRKPRGTTASRVAFVKLDKLSAALGIAWGDGKPPSPAGVLAKIHQELQPSINEIFFTPALVIVEGLEDVAYITTYLQLTDKWNEYRRLGCHLVPANGKNHIVQPLAVANELGIPTFVVFDADGDETNADKRVKHERDNKAIFTLCGLDAVPLMPADNFWNGRCVAWKSTMGDIVRGDFDPKELETFMAKARHHCGHVGGLDKNGLFIADFLTEAWNAGKRSGTLQKLCSEIIAFAKKAAAA